MQWSRFVEVITDYRYFVTASSNLLCSVADLSKITYIFNRPILLYENVSENPSPHLTVADEDSLMSEDRKSILLHHKNTLKTSMEPVNVMNILRAKDILTDDEVGDIKAVSQGENTGKIVDKLIDILIRRKTNRAFTVLLTALDKTGQKPLANMIRKS